MGRKPCCVKEGLNRGAWSEREDKTLSDYVELHGEGKWRDLPLKAGLKRCGKSCRLRWLNYLRPGIKRGNFAEEEEELIIRLHKLLGNRWSLIAGRIPGRTDNEIKNYWNTTLSRRVNDDPKSKLDGPSQNIKPKSTKKPPTTKQRAEEAIEPQQHHEVIRTKATRFTRTVNVRVNLQGQNENQRSPSLEVNEGSNSEDRKGSPSLSSSGINEDHLLADFDVDLFLSESPSSNFDRTNNSSDDGDCYGLVGDYFEDDDDHFRPYDYSDFDHVSFAKFLASEAEWNA